MTDNIKLVLLLCCLCLYSPKATASTSLAQSSQQGGPLVSQEAISTIEEIIKQEILNNLARAHLGQAPEYAATSCKQIAELKPQYDSGYYWVRGPSGPTGVYCEMRGESMFGGNGGWTRIAHVNMTCSGSQCPPGLEFNVTQGKRLCQRPHDRVSGCSSTTFPTYGIRYSMVCGKVIGYQYGNTNGFGPARNTNQINGTYLDGVSLTHGSPRQHVWSFAAALQEPYFSPDPDTACPCISFARSFQGTIPPFAGNDYYCETGSHGQAQHQYYFEDPLWDGEGCTGENHCCERGGPWFCKELPQATTDDIELRICTNSHRSTENIPLEVIELYIQ